MSEEQEKPAIPLEVKIELESQQAASEEHAKAEKEKGAEILDIGTDRKESPGVSEQPVDQAAGVKAPELQPEPAPARPTIAIFSGDFSKRTPCPECGRAGWKSEQALKAHVRFAHELPRKKAEALKNGGNGSPEADTIPAPDFSDIPGESNRIPPAQEPSIASKRYESMANMTFDMSTGILCRIFGPEWGPSSVDERTAVVVAIQKYYESVELPDIPPGYMLCFVCAAYAAPRMAQQPTRTKLQAAWLWLKMKFSRRRPIPMVKIVKDEKHEM